MLDQYASPEGDGMLMSLQDAVSHVVCLFLTYVQASQCCSFSGKIAMMEHSGIGAR
jgi:hypothetical protein